MSGERLPEGDSPAMAASARVVGQAPVPANGTFSMALPKTWRPVDVPPVTAIPPPGPPVLLALYGGDEISGVAPFAQVQLARLERDIAAEHWLRFYLDQMQMVPREIEAISDNAADALVGQKIGGRVVATRVMVRLYSSFAYIVVAGVAAEVYGRFKDALGLAVRSFILGSQSPEGHVEKWQNVSAAGGPSFSIGGSWTVETIAGPDGMRGAFDLTNAEAGGAVVGKMRVRWLTSSFPGSDADEAKKMVEEFKMAGVQVGEVLRAATERKETGSCVVSAEAVRAATVAGDDRSLEFWQVAALTASHRVLLAMLAPAQSQSFYWWAVNRRALETIVSTMQ